MSKATSSRKILFVINSLDGGGAERMICTIASALVEEQKQWALTLATLDEGEDKYALPLQVARIRLNSGGRLISSIFSLLGLIKRERPDVTVSFLTRANCATVACSQLLQVPCIISERVHTTSHFSSYKFRSIHRLLVRSFYPRANRVIAVSTGIRDDLVRNYGVPESQIVTVHNPVEIDKIERASQMDPSICLPSVFAVAVGRLVANKNFPLLLRSYAQSGISGSLIILGDGPERKNLECLASELGISKRVLMPGFIENPHAIVRRAHIYVSASNAEGFPNAMLEAMGLGIPIIATDCDTGPAEILQGSSEARKFSGPIKAAFGILVPPNDEQAMSTALRVMMDVETRTHFSTAARQRARDFRLEYVVAQYRSIINEVIEQQSPYDFSIENAQEP